MSYPFAAIERRWQAYWDEHKSFRTPEDPRRPKYYVLDMFPYPSGAGLHVGHPEGYTATDIMARYKRMRGFNVLHPMGWDAFGLPAERYAMQTGIHPSITTKENINNFRRQLKSLGFSYDWDREISTTHPDYYRWTQWIFLKIFNSYFDEQAQRAKPISELKIPKEIAKDPQKKEDYVNSRRLAYIAEMPVNWCAELGTVLANEEVEEWTSKGYSVERKPMRQWMLRITAYAERLLEGLDELDWPNGTLELQRNWIGRSEGAEIDFPLADSDGKPSGEAIRVFTTRPDTIFGVTYMVLAPEHPLVAKLTSQKQKQAVQEYAEQAKRKSDLDRQVQGERADKSGVFTGGHALHPLTGEEIPVWIADYVLMTYGTGAIMAVPAHDERDFAFARKFDLPVRVVIEPQGAAAVEGKTSQKAQAGNSPQSVAKKSSKKTSSVQSSARVSAEAETSAKARAQTRAKARPAAGALSGPGPEERRLSEEKGAALEQAFVGQGVNVYSDLLNGRPTSDAIATMVGYLEDRGLGKRRINYKLRDWLFSRQRYWGEPIPVSFDENGCLVPESEDDLPLELPPSEEFKPAESGESPLARLTDWVNFKKDGKRLRRETNTMPQWAGSCWYYLRFADPRNDDALIDSQKDAYWMENGVDLYVGGAEHAVLHLLYARFWHKILYDLGVVSSQEPFRKLVHQGLILGEDGEKMSKSRGNVVNPDAVLQEHGADAFRMYEMFLGPLEQVKPWSSEGIHGVYRFLSRVWRLFVIQKDGGPARTDAEPEDEAALKDAQIDPKLLEEPDEKRKRSVDRVAHQSIQKVSEDIERMSFNTAISQMMIFVNEFYTDKAIGRENAEAFVKLLAPFAPHMAEELWRMLGEAAGEQSDSITDAPWPEFDPEKTKVDEIEVVFQVNGKVRAKAKVAPDTPKEEMEKLALAEENIQRAMDGKGARKIIVVPNKLVNIVV